MIATFQFLAQVVVRGIDLTSPRSFCESWSRYMYSEAPSMSEKIKMSVTAIDGCYAYLLGGIYNAYFYAIREHPNLTDDVELRRVTITTQQVARRAIEEFKECGQLLAMGLLRESVPWVSATVFDMFGGHRFIQLKGECNESLPLHEIFCFLINQTEYVDTKNIRFIAEERLPYSPSAKDWTVTAFHSKQVTQLSRETFIKVHKIAMNDIALLCDKQGTFTEMTAGCLKQLAFLNNNIKIMQSDEKSQSRIA